MKQLPLAVSFLFLFSLIFVSAVGIDNPTNLPIVKPDDIDFDPNITVNVSVDSAKNWDTSDHGELGAVSDLMHNWLGGLQGGSANEYYHLNSSIYTYLLANIYDWVTLSEVNTLLSNQFDQSLNTTDNVTFVNVTATNFNGGSFTGDGSGLTGVPFDYPHDQELNTTDNVTFNTLQVSCVGKDGANESCVNVTGDAYFRDIHARDVYVSNNTLYIGDTITLSAGGGALGSVLNVSGGNVTVGTDGYYFGSGQYLTDINLTGISFDGDTINASQFNGGNFSGQYDWIAEAPWLYFNGTYLYFNSSKLKADAEVTLQTEVTVIPIAGGTGSATTANVIDFEIKEFDVACTAGTNFRFEASETTGGAIIDKNRKVHNDDWRIEKNYPINDTVDLDFTSVTPAASSCTVTIKYLDNFE